MDRMNYKNFFDNLLTFKDLQNKQKARGLNDFNLLTTVLKYHDEVRLHSRMIGALIDPSGMHYQGTLFLEKFINSIGLSDFGLNFSNVTIGIEYKDIDLYITDGTKHVIIENKIWAEDQPCQIIKYVNIIVEENKASFNYPKENSVLDESLLRVFYLTPRNKDVSIDHKITDGYIEYKNTSESLKKYSENMKIKKTIDFDLKNYKAKYKKIGYKKILKWLKESHDEIRNITNLSESINQYINVVERVNKNYKGNVMTLESYMDNNEELYQYLKELTEVKNNIEPKFWDELFNKLKNETSLSGIYHIDFNQKSEYKNKPQIKIYSQSDSNNFIFIRRNHNTFYGFSCNEENQELSKYFGREDKKYWEYTIPTINFHNYDEKYWKISKPSERIKAVQDITEQVIKLSKELEKLNLL